MKNMTPEKAKAQLDQMLQSGQISETQLQQIMQFANQLMQNSKRG